MSMFSWYFWSFVRFIHTQILLAALPRWLRHVLLLLSPQTKSFKMDHLKGCVSETCGDFCKNLKLLKKKKKKHLTLGASHENTLPMLKSWRKIDSWIYHENHFVKPSSSTFIDPISWWNRTCLLCLMFQFLQFIALMIETVETQIVMVQYHFVMTHDVAESTCFHA